MSRVAESYLRQVIAADVDELCELPFAKGQFDVLLFADVLEHTRDPWSILERFRPYLSDGGHVVLSLPNIANLAVRVKLLCGIFEYKSKGILDDSHLRFFTLKTASRMLAESGYCITTVETTFSLRSWGLEHRFWYARMTDWLGAWWPGLLAYQFIFKASKAKVGEPDQ
jgi:SAM-dependent methyltransferase